VQFNVAKLDLLWNAAEQNSLLEYPAQAPNRMAAVASNEEMLYNATKVGFNQGSHISGVW